MIIITLTANQLRSPFVLLVCFDPCLFVGEYPRIVLGKGALLVLTPLAFQTSIFRA